MTSPVNIIAIGGGKGGVGKSVIATNLAVGLALGGQHVVLIDTDFGASNLHALLGISNPPKGFLDFFARNEKNPNSLLLDTGISNLKFVSGAGDNLGSANLEAKLQKKVINFISALNANHILLDLGPGTSYNVIDYFNIGTQGVVLAIPEMPSVMNAFSFIKNTLFRLLSQKLSDNVEIQELMDFSKNPAFAHEMYSMDQLKKGIETKYPGMRGKIDSVIASFKPNLILNRVRKKKDLLLGKHLQKLVKKYLNVDLEFLGYLVESDKVRDSVNEMVPFLIKDPQSKPSENLQRVIGALTQSNLHLIKKDGAIFVSKQIRLSSGWDT